MYLEGQKENDERFKIGSYAILSSIRPVSFRPDLYISQGGGGIVIDHQDFGIRNGIDACDFGVKNGIHIHLIMVDSVEVES